MEVAVVDRLMDREGVGVEEPVRLATLGVGGPDSVPVGEAVIDDVDDEVNDRDCAAVRDPVIELVPVWVTDCVEDVVTAADAVPVMEGVCVPVIVLVGVSVSFAVAVVDLLAVAVRVCVIVTDVLAVTEGVPV